MVSCPLLLYLLFWKPGGKRTVVRNFGYAYNIMSVVCSESAKTTNLRVCPLIRVCKVGTKESTWGCERKVSNPSRDKLMKH